MRRSFFALIFCFIVSLHLQAQTGYKNPILQGFYPDPSVCRVGDGYYLVNSSFGYFPGVPISQSKDLIHWEQIGYVLTAKEQVPLESHMANSVVRGIFAPTIRYHDGTFYMITTNFTILKNFIVTAKDPKSHGPTGLDRSSGRHDCPLTFVDDDGKMYFTTTPDADLSILANWLCAVVYYT